MHKFFYPSIIIIIIIIFTKIKVCYLVHFTAQTRFSLIRESVHDDRVAEPNSDDYTCLQHDREKYDSYCSLRKDDLDLVSGDIHINEYTLMNILIIIIIIIIHKYFF